jgi:hypothetical protein
MVKGLQRVGDTAWLSRNGFNDDEATEICKIEEICRQIPKQVGRVRSFETGRMLLRLFLPQRICFVPVCFQPSLLR